MCKSQRSVARTSALAPPPTAPSAGAAPQGEVPAGTPGGAAIPEAPLSGSDEQRWAGTARALCVPKGGRGVAAVRIAPFRTGCAPRADIKRLALGPQPEEAIRMAATAPTPRPDPAGAEGRWGGRGQTEGSLGPAPRLYLGARAAPRAPPPAVSESARRRDVARGPGWAGAAAGGEPRRRRLWRGSSLGGAASFGGRGLAGRRAAGASPSPLPSPARRPLSNLAAFYRAGAEARSLVVPEPRRGGREGGGGPARPGRCCGWCR